MPKTVGSGRGDYRRFVPVTTRWADNDIYGHINNVAYYAFIDTAVNQLMIEAGVLDIIGSDSIGLAVESGCRYHAPVAYPSLLHAGVRVAHLGSSSVRYEVGIFADDGEQAVAEGFLVHVFVGRDDRRPRPMSSALRAFLQTMATHPATGAG